MLFRRAEIIALNQAVKGGAQLNSALNHFSINDHKVLTENSNHFRVFFSFTDKLIKRQQNFHQRKFMGNRLPLDQSTTADANTAPVLRCTWLLPGGEAPWKWPGHLLTAAPPPPLQATQEPVSPLWSTSSFQINGKNLSPLFSSASLPSPGSLKPAAAAKSLQSSVRLCDPIGGPQAPRP